jgi:hypothetical protein
MFPSMIRLKVLLFVILFSAFNYCHLSQKETPIIFIDNQRYLNWFDANEFCRNQRMRLPDYKEIEWARKSGITSTWKDTVNADPLSKLNYWVSTNDERYASFYSIQLESSEVQMSADKNSKKFVRCVKDPGMEKRISLSKPILNWSSYQGYMTKYEAIRKCNELGMNLPTEKEFRHAYFSRITYEWIKEYKSENLSYGGISDQGFDLFSPGIEIFAFSKWQGNAHIRCIGK